MNNSSSTLLLKTFAKTILFAFCMVLDFGAIVLDVQNAGKTDLARMDLQSGFRKYKCLLLSCFSFLP